MKRNPLHSLFLLPAAGFGLPLLPGCTPQVYTHVTRSYPPLAHGDTVAVFAPDQTPPAAEVLGELSVQNSGFTHPFTYAHAVALASDAVVSVGGNGLHVTEHKASSFVYSGRRRITGQMLRLPDSVCRELLTDTLYTFLAGRKPVAAQAGKGATMARTGKTLFMRMPVMRSS